MKKFGIIAIGILISTTSYGQTFGKLKEKVNETIGTSGTSLTEGEVADGLKEALNNGIEQGVSRLSKPDGYFKDPQIKIPLPEEAKVVEEKLRQLGQGDKVDEAIESINRAAEDAADDAKDIFLSAIKNMTVTDAMGLLKGNDDAATRFLENTTRDQLVEKFKPIIHASLEKVGATKHWNTVFTTYNKIPLVTKVNPDLDEYATNKAIDGLFIQIAKQELEIRKNPGARVTDLLKKVFGS